MISKICLRSILLSIALCLPGHGQTVGKSELDKIRNFPMSQSQPNKSLASKIAAAERTIKRAERAAEDFAAATGFGVDRKRERAERLIDESRKALKEIVGVPSYSELKQRLDAAENSFTTGNASATISAEDKDARLKRLNGYKSSGELAQDASELEALGKALGNPRRYLLDAAVFSRRGSPQQLDQMVSDTQNWSNNLARFEELASKYESLGEGVFFRATGAFAEISSTRPAIKETYSNMEAFSREGYKAIELALSDAQNIAQQAVEDEDYGVFTGLNSRMRLTLVRPNALARVFSVLPVASEQQKTAVNSLLESGLDEITRTQVAVREKIIENNQMEADVYQGADRSAILSIASDGFKEIHGDQQIFELRIPAGQWERTVGWRWDSVRSQYSYIDYSTIDVYVIEKSSPTIGTIWKITVNKKHLENDALISDPASRHRHTPVPDQQILIRNL